MSDEGADARRGSDGAPSSARADARSIALFQSGEFRLHSGAASSFKIDCDALTDNDWLALADMISDHVGKFTLAIGVPTGGLKLAAAMNKVKWNIGPVLVVDDVLTTGASMEEARALAKLQYPYREIRGAVVFARGPVPAWVTPLFVMSAGTEVVSTDATSNSNASTGRAREATADDIREQGWSVAVHNDYKHVGESFTFWLFTKGARAVKGEGRTDAEALNLVRAALSGESTQASQLISDAARAVEEVDPDELEERARKMKDGKE